MELKNLKNKTVQELILMALTYRVSYKNLTSLLDAPEDEIREVFYSFLDLQEVLHYLDMETRDEDEVNSRVAYIHAKNYLSKRQLIMKELTLAKREGNEELIEKLKKDLNEHIKLVSDEFVISTIGKSINALTQEEKDAIAKFRLKYGASKKWCEGQLRRDKRTITRIDEDLASRNQIFKEKIDLLDSYWHEKHKEFVADYARRGR